MSGSMNINIRNKWPESSFAEAGLGYQFKQSRTVVGLLATILLFCSNTFASQEKLDSLVSQEKELTQELQKTNAEIKSLEGRLQSTNSNSVKLLKNLRRKRATLQSSHRSLRAEGQDKRRELSTLYNEKAGTETKLKLASTDSEKTRLSAELNQLIGKIEQTEALQSKIQDELLDIERRIDSLSPQSNTAYVTLSEDQTQIEEDLIDARRSTVSLRRKLRSFAAERAQLQAELQAELQAQFQAQIQAQREAAEAQAEKSESQNLDSKPDTDIGTPTIVSASIPAQGEIRLPSLADYPAGTDLADLDRLVKIDSNQAEPSAYVFVISGKQDPNIDETLRLKEWVEGFGARFIAGSWNNILSEPGEFNSQTTVVQQMRRVLRSIPQNSNLILIGHGLGGGTAIRIATEAAYEINRRVDYLAVMDPTGIGQLRVNIVRQSDQRPCLAPGNTQETITDYLNCVKRFKGREITGNVLNFYNRWQKEVAGPLDYDRSLLSSEDSLEFSGSSTGRFETPATTRSDQMRLFYNNKQANRMLLTEASDVLPNLLIEYLR